MIDVLKYSTAPAISNRGMKVKINVRIVYVTWARQELEALPKFVRYTDFEIRNLRKYVFDINSHMSRFAYEYLILCLERRLMFFQDLWIRKLSWDEELPTEICEKWTQWCLEIPLFNKIRVPRIFSYRVNQIMLKYHCFGDASQTLAGLFYLWGKDYDQMSVHIILSKTRVAPVQRVTLSRLELLCALLSGST